MRGREKEEATEEDSLAAVTQREELLPVRVGLIWRDSAPDRGESLVWRKERGGLNDLMATLATLKSRFLEASRLWGTKRYFLCPLFQLEKRLDVVNFSAFLPSNYSCLGVLSSYNFFFPLRSLEPSSLSFHHLRLWRVEDSPAFLCSPEFGALFLSGRRSLVKSCCIFCFLEWISFWSGVGDCYSL